MKQVSYNEEETVYLAARSLEEARDRLDIGFAPYNNPQAAWDALDYFERTEEYDSFEVFKFVTTVQVTKVDPPYTPRS